MALPPALSISWPASAANGWAAATAECGYSQPGLALKPDAPSGWIGKAGMVLPPEHYVGSDSPHAHRKQVATEDKSWSAKHIDIKAKRDRLF